MKQQRLLVALVALAFVISFAPAGTLPAGITLQSDGTGYIVDLSLPSFQKEIRPGNGTNYVALAIPDYGVTSEVGLPALPRISFNLMIAPDEQRIETSLLDQTVQREVLEYKVYPAQQPWPKSRPLSERPFTINRDYYNSTGSTGQPLVSVSEPFVMAGARGVMITFSPFAYNPSTNELVVTQHARIRIALQNRPRAEGRFTPSLSKMLDNMFVNFEAKTILGHGNYLIITAPEFEMTLSSFVSFKQAGGYPVYVANTTLTGTTNTAIKNFIQQRYNNPDMRPEFILLVGDVDRVPEWIGSTTDNPHTDLFYTLLDGPDYYSDAFIGRFAIANTTELQNIINKTIFMETSINGLPKKNVFMASSDNWAITEGTHNAVIDTFFGPNSYVNLKRYVHTYGATTAQVLADFNDNQTFIIYSGHGSETSWADGPPVSQSQVRTLTNTVFPYVYSFACLTGSFETSECFGETWIRNTIGASTFWGSSVTSYWDEDDILEKRLVRAMFADTLIQSAPMFTRGKTYFATYFGGFTSTVKRYFEMYNLLGDPSVHTAQFAENFGWAQGTITNASGGALLSGVTVNFTQSIQQQGCTSDQYGHYLAGAKVDTPGTTVNVTLRARKFGFRDTLIDMPLTRNDTLTHNFSMVPAAGGTLAVHAYRNDNSGIRANVRILFNSVEVITDYTDSTTGNFSTPLPAGTYSVLVNPPSPYGNRTFSNVVISVGQTTSLDALVRYVVEPSPVTLRDTLAVGGSHAKTLMLTNTTADSVPWRISLDLPVTLSRRSNPRAVERSMRQQSSLTLPKNVADTRSEPLTPDGRGGPDAFGNMWVDSDEPDGPLFNWFDIRSVGTQISSWTGTSDDGYATIPLPFNFPFYGANWTTSINVCTNGFISRNATSTAYSNAAIPTTAVPNDAIYPFWDDLDVGSGGTVHYFNDAARNRFIVQFTAVQHYSNTGTYTFQVILHPNGLVLIQYLTMSGVLNSATIGIENSAGTVALQVVYNAAYVHDNLALAFLPPGVVLPTPWLACTPRTGVLAPGAVQNVTGTLNATGLTPGTTYNGTILLDVTHPNVTTGPISVPTSLTVETATLPLLIVSKDSIGFPATPLNTTRLDSITARNGGSQTLAISSITSTNPRFVVTPASANIPPGDSIRLRLSYTPPAPAIDTGRVIILSNSSTGSRKDVLLRGSSFGLPRIVASPDSFTFTRQPGNDTTEATFTIRNPGTDTLRYVINKVMGSGSTASVQRSIQQQASYMLGKNELDSRAGQPPALDGQGGPDSAGYRWFDSDDPGGPAYSWFDIKPVGTQITTWSGTTDDGYATVPLPFSFPFYGASFTSLNICTNGFAQFSGTSTTYSNTAIPSVGEPNNAIYPFWDDLNLGEAGGSVWYYNDAARQRFIFQFDSVSHYSPSSTPGRYTFQTILYPDGRILVQYRKMEGTLNSATIGIENGGGTVALQVVFNSAYVHDNLALLFTQDAVPWMSCGTTSGTIAQGDSQNVHLCIHPREMPPGLYTGYFRITGNSPDTVNIKVKLTIVTGVAENNVLLPTSYELSQNYPNPFNPSTTIRFALPHESSVKLKVFNLLGQEVISLLDEIRPAGYFTVPWDGRTQSGITVATGIYFYRLEANPTNGGSMFTSLKKMMLLK